MVSEKSNVQLKKSTKETIIKDLKITNPEVYNFLLDKKDRESWVEKAIIIGCVGLKQIVLAENVDFVEKEFNKFLQKTKENFEKQADSINEKIDTTFDIEKKNSPIAQFTSKLDKTFDLNNSDSPLAQFKELIEEYFDSKKGKLREIIEEYFDTDTGKIKKLIDSSFDLDNKKSAFSRLIKEIKDNTDLEEEAIQELMDPNKTDSPAKLLKEEILTKFKELKDEDLKEINEKIKEIRDKILKEEAIEEEKEKGTEKGLEFEEIVLEELEEIAKNYEDEIRFVGGKKVAGSKVGDITIDLNGDPKKRVVVECKNSRGYSAKKTKDEINDAIKNRKAQLGIFLFNKKEQMPPALCPIKITNNYIITYLEKDNLNLCYRLARILLIREKPKGEDKIDLEKVAKELNSIEEVIKNIDNMQAKVKNILNSGEYLRDNLADLHRQIDSSIGRIKDVFEDKLPEVDESTEGEVENYVSDLKEEISSTNNLITSSSLGMFIGKCAVCGNKFETVSKSKKYCSYDCRDEAARLRRSK